jgi:hypothetical protein
MPGSPGISKSSPQRIFWLLLQSDMATWLVGTTSTELPRTSTASQLDSVSKMGRRGSYVEVVPTNRSDTEPDRTGPRRD